jgi:hypothetical protein
LKDGFPIAAWFSVRRPVELLELVEKWDLMVEANGGKEVMTGDW